LEIINPDIIQSGERKLIRFIAKQLDWHSVRQSIKETYNVAVNESLEHKSGKIVSHEGDVAYQLDFDFKVNLSLLLARDGQQVWIDSPELNSRRVPAEQPSDSSQAGEISSQAGEMDARKEAMDAESSKRASEIAQMISDINNG